MKKELIYKRRENSIKSRDDQEKNYIKLKLLNAINVDINPIFPKLTSDSQYPALNNYEKLKIEEMVTGIRGIFKEENTMEKVIHVDDRKKWMEVSEEYSKHIVKMIKNVPCFKDNTIEQQLLIVKRFIVIFFDLRLIFFYSKATETSMIQQMPEQDICYTASCSLWKSMVSDEFYHSWKMIIEKYKFVMLNDPIVRDLMITISLFWQHDELPNNDYMRYKYLQYYYLLKRYIQVKLKNVNKVEKHLKYLHTALNDLPSLIEFTRKFYIFISKEFRNSILEEIYRDSI